MFLNLIYWAIIGLLRTPVRCIIDIRTILLKRTTVKPLSRTLEGYKIVDHPDVVGASSAGAAPTTSSFSI